MSAVTNIIRTIWTTDGQGRVRAAIGEVQGGYQSLSRGTQEYGRQTGYLNNQLRALGTTFRYSLAGAALFGAYRMITTLQDTQRQLALVGFLGQQSFGGLTTWVGGADQRLQTFYRNAQTASREALVPVAEFNDGLVNLFSTIQVADPNKAVEMVKTIAQGAQFAQVSVEDLTKTIAGMTQSFNLPHTPNIYSREVRGFVSLISNAPGGVAFGPQISQQIPQLAAVARLAKINQSQALGLYLTTLRSGGSPSTTGRGLQYLLQSIAIPPSAQARQALGAAGITPTTVQQHGGLWALNRLISHAKSVGVLTPQVVKNVQGLSSDQLDLLDQQDPLVALQSLGISGPGLAWARQAIGRIHGVRALVQLMQHPGQQQKDINTIFQAQSDTAQAQQAYAKAWQQFVRDQPLKAAAISLDNLRRDIIESLAPGVSAGARGLDWVGRTAHAHPTAEKVGIYGTIALLAGLSVRRFRGGGGLFGGLGRVAGGAAAISSAAGGTTPPTGRANDPLYVIVLSQLSNPGSRGPGGTSVITKAEEAAKTGGKFGWAAGLGTVIGTGAAAGYVEYKLWGGPHGTHNVVDPIINAMGSRGGGGNILNVIGAHRGGRPQHYQFQSPMQQVTGRADVFVTVDAYDKNGKPVTKRVHAPVDLIPYKNGVLPQHRGKSKTQRSN